MYQNLIDSFKDTIDTKNIFNSLNFSSALSSLLDSKNNLKFLIGEPGVGKTFLLNLYKKEIQNPILIDGLISKEEFNKILTQNYDIIIIDEAQLLDMRMIETIRTLSDANKHKFLLSMHLKDAKEILNKEHFKSRSIDIIELQPITKEEMIKYLNSILFLNNANHLFSDKEFKTIYKYTNGNFRYIKKFVRTLFELLDYAQKNKLEKYQQINKCLLTMTAIKLGLENE